MLLANVERACLLVTAIHVLLGTYVDAETFTLGYITGSKRRPDDFEYHRPGFRISGAMTLAVEEVNAGELGERGHKLDFEVQETYGEEQTSILSTAVLWTKNISAYIGPQETCIHEGRMAAAFNIPMISYFCTHHETSNKKDFPTFARTRPPDTQISKSVVSVLLAFNWTKVTFMYMNASVYEFNKMSTVAKTILASFEAAGISLNHVRCWEEPHYTTQTLLMENRTMANRTIMENPFHAHVEDTYRDTRIYVIVGHHYEHVGLLMALDEKNLLEKGEYWVVGVDIKQYDEQQPEHYLRGHWQWNRMEMNLSIKAYRNYFSIVASAPIDIMKFAQKVNDHRQKPPFNFANPVGKMKGIVQVTTRDHGITKLHSST